MGFWKSFGAFLKASVYDPPFYRSFADRPAGSLVGFFALIVLVAAVMTSFPALRAISSFVFQPSREADTIRQYVLDLYPDWLEFTIKDGRLSMNADSPYAVPMPRGMVAEANDPKLPANLVVINVEKPVELSDFKAYDTLIVLGADQVGIYDENKGKAQIQDISQFLEEPYTMTKGAYAGFVRMFEKAIRGFGTVLLFLIPVVMWMALFVGYLAYLLFAALVIWLAAWLRKARFGYGTAYKAGLVLITVPVIYNAALALGCFRSIPIPMFFTLIIFILAIANLSSDDQAEAAPAEAAAPAAPAAVASEETPQA
jgi:hypothetical protein